MCGLSGSGVCVRGICRQKASNALLITESSSVISDSFSTHVARCHGVADGKDTGKATGGVQAKWRARRGTMKCVWQHWTLGETDQMQVSLSPETSGDTWKKWRQMGTIAQQETNESVSGEKWRHRETLRDKMPLARMALFSICTTGSVREQAILPECFSSFLCNVQTF